MSWQPIETAPKDGTPILLTSGVLLAAGHFAFRVEEATKYRGYNAAGGIDDSFLERIPNPDAGKRHEWWQIYGCTAFNFEADTHDHDGPEYFTPTHWMPLPDPPLPAEGGLPTPGDRGK